MRRSGGDREREKLQMPAVDLGQTQKEHRSRWNYYVRYLIICKQTLHDHKYEHVIQVPIRIGCKVLIFFFWQVFAPVQGRKLVMGLPSPAFQFLPEVRGHGSDWGKPHLYRFFCVIGQDFWRHVVVPSNEREKKKKRRHSDDGIHILLDM